MQGKRIKTRLNQNNRISQGTILGTHFKVSPVRDNEGKGGSEGGSKEGKIKGEQNDEPHTYVFRG